MPQNINFYALIEKKNKWALWTMPENLQTILLIFLMLLMLISAYDVRMAYRASRRLAALTGEQAAALGYLNDLSTQISGRGSIPFHSEERGMLASQTAFPAVLQALSAVAMEDLWLTGIYISGPNGQVNLTGATLNPVRMQTFLTHLAEQPILKSISFQLVELKESAPTDKTEALSMTFQVVGKG